MKTLVIITGMSGAGKTVALKTMEDLGYYTVDNMPVVLIPKFAELTGSFSHDVAIGVDIRSADLFSDFKNVLTELENEGVECRLLFLDASDKVLLKRFKETRRTHPLSPAGHIEEGIKKEREALTWLRGRSDYIMDTSGMAVKNLRGQLERIFSAKESFRNLYVNILSFGYKYGIPDDADIVMDVRFMPNPFYVDELKEKTGLDPEVREYVLSANDSKEFIDKLTGLIDFLIPKYIEEGKNQLIIAFGCTGGKHRSVTVAETLYSHLSGTADYGLNVEHRDIKR
ncbi:MAG: RNase adapter RapZ [Clostridiales bacterium]|nr:RNase adapter RapZ [Clostridiales bacterium]